MRLQALVNSMYLKWVGSPDATVIESKPHGLEALKSTTAIPPSKSFK